ncbi:hypothetical protein [Amycolatopsis methanolica]|uniref:Putative ArsR family transcriptional regulator ( match) n=1 Tax=Amycolatopsis methanolica 239 TaxID=1068978 RepID=A0A076ML80_AMYME|nr:hypothetical protein [Amycolatopsis methanolica]AIJ21568.1 putative ArsR family transcriptional regulator (match) [Amycolatopsis methanolica 239]
MVRSRFRTSSHDRGTPSESTSSFRTIPSRSGSLSTDSTASRRRSSRIDRRQSTLTHHFKLLRAGVTTQRQYGLERRSEVRGADLDARFPGLLDLGRNWEPPTAAA